LSAHHISGLLKVAPEHVVSEILRLMNKPADRLDDFIKLFNKLNAAHKQYLRYYFLIGHPGEDEQSVRTLARAMKRLGNVDQFQLFVPLPMTVSACMYWTGFDPFTLKPVKVVRDYGSKKELKRIVLQVVESKERRGATIKYKKEKRQRPL
jgi:radical SAM superfamily enzyme YgiQ (UPF0313 family)